MHPQFPRPDHVANKEDDAMAACRYENPILLEDTPSSLASVIREIGPSFRAG